MIAKPSIAFNDFSGTAKDVTARNVNGRNVLSVRAYQSKVFTLAQATTRNPMLNQGGNPIKGTQTRLNMTQETRYLYWNSDTFCVIFDQWVFLHMQFSSCSYSYRDQPWEAVMGGFPTDVNADVLFLSGSTRTAFQSSVKAVFKQFSQAWQGLTNEQILAWNAAANAAQGKSVLGTKSKISGANLFMRLNYWVVYCGGNILTAVLNLSGVEAPAEVTIVLSSSAMTFTLASIPSDVTNLKLVIQAFDPQGNGITRAYSKAAAFNDPYTPVATAIDIKAKYDAKCDAPSVGSPKVFFKYFFVNTATGEKSGDVLAQVKLASE